MNRLAREFQRLFLTTADVLPTGSAQPVRCLLMGVARPAAWAPLGAVWHGVQAELDLPAPAIAVNGCDGLQLWFSLAEPVEATQGLALLEHLRLRYMADVAMHRVTLQASAAPAPMPGPAPDNEQWAAFVAADLAAVFEETPWLDMQPSDEGQAELLSRIKCIAPAVLQAALQRLQPASATPANAVAHAAANVVSDAGPDRQAPSAARPTAVETRLAAHPAAAEFLLQVMQDPTAPLASRVEAAKALLPYGPAC